MEVLILVFSMAGQISVVELNPEFYIMYEVPGYSKLNSIIPTYEIGVSSSREKFHLSFLDMKLRRLEQDINCTDKNTIGKSRLEKETITVGKEDNKLIVHNVTYYWTKNESKKIYFVEEEIYEYDFEIDKWWNELKDRKIPNVKLGEERGYIKTASKDISDNFINKKSKLSSNLSELISINEYYVPLERYRMFIERIEKHKRKTDH